MAGDAGQVAASTSLRHAIGAEPSPAARSGEKTAAALMTALRPAAATQMALECDGRWGIQRGQAGSKLTLAGGSFD